VKLAKTNTADATTVYDALSVIAVATKLNDVCRISDPLQWLLSVLGMGRSIAIQTGNSDWKAFFHGSLNDPRGGVSPILREGVALNS
jgi:hypothetical protein